MHHSQTWYICHKWRKDNAIINANFQGQMPRLWRKILYGNNNYWKHKRDQIFWSTNANVIHILPGMRGWGLLIFKVRVQRPLPKRTNIEIKHSEHDREQIVMCIMIKLRTHTVKHFFSRGLYFRINSQKHGDANIKSSPIISREWIIEQYMTNRENKVPWIYPEWCPRENKVMRIISVLQYCPWTEDEPSWFSMSNCKFVGKC